MTYLRLNRTVARSSSRCHWCTWDISYPDTIYAPVIGGVELARFCSERCAGKSTSIELKVTYV